MNLNKGEQHDAIEGRIIPSELAITALRDSGYKNTAYALAELIDNAQQAGANSVEVLCFEKRELVNERERKRLNEIAVLDNGRGMDAPTLRKALQFGNGTRLNDRSGIGRFGMGLPNASISQAGRVDVWSWQNGADNAIHSYIDVSMIETGKMQLVPNPEVDPVPEIWRSRSDDIGHTGTLVVWTKIDVNRLTWRTAKSTLQNTGQIVGRVHRRFIDNGAIAIRLFAEGEEGDELFDEGVVPNDPLYLMSSTAVPDPFNDKAMFESVGEDIHEIEHNGQIYKVKIHYSLAKEDTVSEAGGTNRGGTNYGKHAAKNVGVSVLRAGRELLLDQGWCIKYLPTERWWGAEVEFPPELDEIFGVPNNKQAANNFSALAAIEWEQLAEAKEDFIDVVRRLQDDRDPYGYLLKIGDSLKKNLVLLRERIKAQGSGLRSSRRNRHNELDPATEAANRGWEKRSRERPVEGENDPPSASDLDDLCSDLIENEKLSGSEAVKFVDLIKDANLKVFFTEADFPNTFELFNVETKGPLTEVVFNRKHPVFDDVFGTINAVDEDVSNLDEKEMLEKLIRASNATKIVFAAWARLEKEGGLDRLKGLQKARFDWGQMAAEFLDPYDDLTGP